MRSMIGGLSCLVLVLAMGSSARADHGVEEGVWADLEDLTFGNIHGSFNQGGGTSSGTAS